MSRSRLKIGDPAPMAAEVIQPAAVTAPPEPAAAWLVEVTEFPIRWLQSLPEPTTLVCTAFGVDVLLAPELTSYAYTFAGPEVDALALAAEHDRAAPPTLYAWLERKAAQPGWRLTSREAIGGLAGGLPPALGWPTRTVLHRLGLTLREVWL